MPCKACEERKRMISAAYKRNGLKGVIKAAPSVAKHIMRHKPVIIRNPKP